MRVVWFKRDLRVHDHAPLAAAAASGEPVCALYVFEPQLWAQPELSGRQFAFLTECLDELDAALRTRGVELTRIVGEAVEVFERLHRAHPITAIHAHEETGLYWTFERDIAVRRWARRAGVAFVETPHFGVARPTRPRSGWARRWDRTMAAPATPAPNAIRPASIASEEAPDAAALGLADDPCPERQPGGRAAGRALVASFLGERGRHYRREMSSPVTAFQACSRLSPYLAFGALSMRETTQAAHAALAAKRAAGEEAFAASLASFVGRLHWHCHFIQKLEDEPHIERRCLHPAYEDLRAAPADDDPPYRAWADARTGFPFVDACMRALAATGWLNFRMRAMLMAFASYHLWLDWRRPAQHLAALFTDFEAGIHYPQAQMQSGVTGVNTVRIYNPVKQSRDQDPDGVFIRAWIPEIATLPDAFLHEPWRAPPAVRADVGVTLGETYPMPIIDHLAAARAAKERVYAVRRGEGYREVANAIQERHGSRRSGMRHRGRRPPRAKANPRQPQLDFGAE